MLEIVFGFVALAILATVVSELMELIIEVLAYVIEQLFTFVLLVLQKTTLGVAWCCAQLARGVLWSGGKVWLGTAWCGVRAGRGALWCARKAGRAGWEVLVFLYYIADEAFRSATGRVDEDGSDYEEGGQTDGNTDYEDEPDDDEDQVDAYEQALRLLGLPAGCTREEFNRAYKRAIGKAHPDKGGTHEQALAVNAARDTVMIHNGWRR